MEKVFFVLCCFNVDGSSFAFTFNFNERNALLCKYHYYLERGCHFVFYSLRSGVLEMSDILDFVS